jgi:WD40 repeat protein
LEAKFEGHFDSITGIKCLPKTKFFVSVSLDGTIRKFNIESRGYHISNDSNHLKKANNILTPDEERELQELLES